MNLETFYNKLSVKIRPGKLTLAAFGVLSLAGFFDSVFLVYKHFTASPLRCFIFEGCDTVTTSPYSTIGPIPVALLGAGYYLAVFLLTIYYLDRKNLAAFGLARVLVAFGFLASIWFVFLHIVIIKAICFYCVVSAAITTLLFILALVNYFGSKRERGAIS